MVEGLTRIKCSLWQVFRTGFAGMAPEKTNPLLGLWGRRPIGITFGVEGAAGPAAAAAKCVTWLRTFPKGRRSGMKRTAAPSL